MTKTKIYAENTKVPSHQTLMQIQMALKKAGATKFMILSDEEEEGVAFARNGITYHMAVTIRDEKRRSALLRALLLIVKAKIVAVDSGVRSFEEEFLADILTDDGRTYGKRAVPEIRAAIEHGHYPKSLPMPGR